MDGCGELSVTHLSGLVDKAGGTHEVVSLLSTAVPVLGTVEVVRIPEKGLDKESLKAAAHHPSALPSQMSEG